MSALSQHRVYRLYDKYINESMYSELYSDLLSDFIYIEIYPMRMICDLLSEILSFRALGPKAEKTTLQETMVL